MDYPASYPNSGQIVQRHNGYLPIYLGWRGLWRFADVIGGPYANFYGNGFFGVCLREEVPRGVDFDVHLPIRDFSVPDSPEDVVMAIKHVVVAILKGHNVYVGCMGGWGRTGLFLALLTKATGTADDPVAYVRHAYTPKAVETLEQEQYVQDFDVSWFKPWLLRASWMHIRGYDIMIDG